MAHDSISLIITTFQEEASITLLLDSICKQTLQPDEVIIADAGSQDRTLETIAKYHKKLPMTVLKLPFHTPRSIARNAAIQQAAGTIIAITDAGCILDPTWLAHMCAPFATLTTDVVAGFYRGDATTIFERAQLPFVLVMPDQINDTFLPATRSMAIRKAVFLKAGMFREDLRYGEDYAFARKLRSDGYHIVVAKDALVSWRPRATLSSFARMLYEHAYGDAYSETSRPKVSLIFGRYIGALVLGLAGFIWSTSWWVLLVSSLLYLFYAFFKHARYVRYWKGIVYSPLLQLTADFAVMVGTVRGMLAKKA